MINHTKNKNNERAKFAYDELKKLKEEKNFSPEQQSKFRSLARSFPTTVQVNGLTAAIAFLFAKGKGEHKELYDILSKKLCVSEKEELIETVAHMESNELKLATSEVMALLVWIKRFAEGMFKDGEKDNE